MKKFLNNIIKIHGKEGQKWLADLPDITKQFQGEWGLSDLKPIQGMSYHYMLSGTQKDQPIMLKLGLDVKGMRREVMALKTFEKYGGIKIMEEAQGALLLERVEPGYTLTELYELDDLEAIDVVCAMMMRLHKAPLPEGQTFVTLKERLKPLDQEWPGIPEEVLFKARDLRDKLLTTCIAPVMLHGDLHHENILQSPRHEGGWVAIDPKGLIGEACYDIPAFIRNPIAELIQRPDLSYLIKERVNYFADKLSLDPQRLLVWSYVQGVMAWIWMIEDGLDTSPYQKLVEIFGHLLSPKSKNTDIT